MNVTGAVLIVDGDASVRSLLEVVVRMLPKRAVVAEDGRKALELLESQTFDAVVLELVLPELSGADVLAHVAARTPELLPHTVIVTTAPESVWSAVRETRACAAVLRKPFALEELRLALRDCCTA
jgi:DNA-binding NtrC family response regulator